MSNEQIPEVIPMVQTSTNEFGEGVLRRVGPVTYALMACVKTLLGQEDTIEISDDERRSVWFFSNEKFEYSGVIKVDEDTALISLLMQWDDEEVLSTRALNEINTFLLRTNNLLSSGQVFLSNRGLICFKNSIDVEGIASEDPDYHGPHLIQPRLIFNMFVFACSVFERVIEDLQQLEFNDSECFIGSGGNPVDLICYEKFLTRNAKAKRISFEMLKTIAVEQGDGPNTDAKAEPSLLGLVQESTVVYFKEGTSSKYRGANLEGQYFKLDNLKILENGQVELMLEFLWYKWKPKTSWGKVVADRESFLLHPNFNGYAVAELA